MSAFLILLSGDIGALVNMALMIAVPIGLISGVIAYKLVGKTASYFVKILIAAVTGTLFILITMSAFFSILG